MPDEVELQSGVLLSQTGSRKWATLKFDLFPVRLSDPANRSLAKGNEYNEEKVVTAKGTVLVAWKGDRTKPALLTFHDLGLSHVSNFQVPPRDILFKRGSKLLVDGVSLFKRLEILGILQLSWNGRNSSALLRVSSQCPRYNFISNHIRGT